MALERDDKSQKQPRGRVIGWRLIATAAALVLAPYCYYYYSLPLFFESQEEASNNHNGSDSSSHLITKFSAVNDAPDVLNVHIVPHTHDDVGWLKTVDQYFYGTNNSIDTRGNVQQILTTTVEALQEHSARTFTYVEMKFFSKWWNRQSSEVQDSVRWLVAGQQLQFTNGGWCMHDEASAHFQGMMDQTTLGHLWLKEQLGVVPQTAWQLDPFGHSSTQADLLTYRAGLQAVYFGRIDYQDLELRQRTRQCEGFWKTRDGDTTAAGGAPSVFWGLTGSYGGNYGAPPGFCFDVQCDDRLVGLDEAALEAKMEAFLQDLRVQSDQTIDNHIQLTFGMDFQVRVCLKLMVVVL